MPRASASTPTMAMTAVRAREVRGAVVVGAVVVEMGVVVGVVHFFFSFCAFRGHCPDDSRVAAGGVAHRRSMRG